MAQIAPFRAFRYDPTRVSLSQVVTQPYDKITPEMQGHYHAASPYNLVRIILGKPELGDTAASNLYTRAAGYFRDWRRQGILLQDREPAIYIYVQKFTLPDQKSELERRGFIALGRIEDYAAGVIFRHEQTLAKPKADRLELLRATRAHFGQIFMLYQDPGGEIDPALTPSSEPTIEVRDEYGVVHLIWKLTNPETIALVQARMADKKLIIADGHHRYETALNYRNERRAIALATAAGSLREGSSGATVASAPDVGEAAYDRVMMTFVNMDTPGLVILPTHRVVHGLSSFSAENFQAAAKRYFSVEEVDPGIDGKRATAILRQAGLMGTALLAVTADRAFLLDRPSADGSQIFHGISLRQQALDVVQLHKVILEAVLGLSQPAILNQQNISYVRDAQEALSRVRRQGAQIALLMNPVLIRQVRDIAFAGEVLPQKSTDFYPKLLSGLTTYALE